MHNRRCSESQPTDKYRQSNKALQGRDYGFGLIISPHAGLCWGWFRVPQVAFCYTCSYAHLVPAGLRTIIFG
ncbi:MAG: hypothetical protein LBP87_13380 [Planctomycetaceae bacterium]|nr:hypothetical protein [Planctomycetaceae bacterium]